jgi:hypothetical protein
MQQLKDSDRDGYRVLVLSNIAQTDLNRNIMANLKVVSSIYPMTRSLLVELPQHFNLALGGIVLR